MRLICFLFPFVMLMPMYVHGQGKYTLNGRLHVKDGDTYPYKLVFDVTDGTISGYSVTKISDGTETKAAVIGHLNRKKQTLTVTETKVFGEPQKDVINCLVDAKMMYKLQGGNFLVIGTFKGKDEQKKPCGEGLIEFREANKPGSLFYTDTLPAASSTASDSAAKNELITNGNIITAGVGKQYDWATDTCVLEIWDAGVIDGDVVSVLFNDKPVLSNYTLAKEKKQLKLPLLLKSNTLTIVAEDEGSSPPNTAQLTLSDGDTRYKITAFNKKGEKAVIVIRKK